jgi:uncharacterized membrane protein
MAETHTLLTDITRLNELEQRILHGFLHRERVARDTRAEPASFGDRVADRVASFGGSWPFILIALMLIAFWMLFNIATKRAFDPYPFILLNLVLSCLAALQAPVIMMSQNRQATHDRIDAQHDYEVNTRAEMEIVALHTKLDEIREQKWTELMGVQERQIALLTRLIAQGGQT